MKGKTLSDNFAELNEIVRSYLNARYDYLRILILEKLTKIGTYFITTLSLVTIFLFVLLFLTFAFSFWYSQHVGEISEAFLICAGFYLILGIIVYALRKPLFSGSIVRNISDILFPENEDEI
ncbi:MAG: hypothetical protein GVY19_02340 [Bacteroidetes bacterium]|jgi:uncharacterized membrane protein|nr:hypothetical protein [Bacteroidota bacterium]